MIAVLDSPAMREADRVTIAELGLPSLVLMESAAAAVADLVAERFPGAGRIAVACGPGNNGGDGLAMARLLRCRGFDVSVGMLVARRSLKGDAAVQLELARRFGVPVSDCSRGGTARLAELLGGADVVVDALFGTGLDRPLTGRWAETVSVVNRAGVPVVAIDIPSGLLGSSAGADGPSVRADLTVTFAAPKVAHVLPPACWRCGEVAVAAIGIPPWVADARMSLGLVEADDVAGWLPRRGPDALQRDVRTPPRRGRARGQGGSGGAGGARRGEDGRRARDRRHYGRRSGRRPGARARGDGGPARGRRRRRGCRRRDRGIARQGHGGRRGTGPGHWRRTRAGSSARSWSIGAGRCSSTPMPSRCSPAAWERCGPAR